MDLPFIPEKWRPTGPPDLGKADPTLDELASLSYELSKQTIDILQHPYDPHNWVRRADTLTSLRYPELATGDAWKAGALCRAKLARLDDQHGHWRLGHRMGFWMVDESAWQIDDQFQRLRDDLTLLQKRARKVETRGLGVTSGSQVGSYLRRPYPWTSRQHSGRDDVLLRRINDEFATNPTCDDGGGPYCVVKRNAFGEGAHGVDTRNVLGMFAARDIAKDELFLIDETRVWGCNGPGVNGDYANLFGGRACSDPLHPNTINDDVELDMRWIRDEIGRAAAEVILRCRLLLCTIQDGASHPLDHHLVARLTPTYRKQQVSHFALADEIAIPNGALQQFGIDIFANLAYDTWVLFTLFARTANNRVGNPMAETLAPLFSFFNHSCDSNVTWSTSGDHTTVRATAIRDVQRGEQLFVGYDGYANSAGLKARREALVSWLDGPCKCTRCEKEERELDAASDGPADWDMADKPVFPEDRW